jgi:purine-cytosine permease-like protein
MSNFLFVSYLSFTGPRVELNWVVIAHQTLGYVGRVSEEKTVPGAW